jgi:spore maturation protein SpmA
MIWWILFLAAVAIFSYLSDVGIITFMKEWRAPYLHASNLSILILLCLAGMIGRLLWMMKRGEKESLAERIMELEKKLKPHKGEEKEGKEEKEEEK